MNHAELKKRIEEVSMKGTRYNTNTYVFEEGEWWIKDCCAFTQSAEIDVRIKPPTNNPLPLTEEELQLYIDFLSELHPDYKDMFNHECPSSSSAEVSLCFEHSMLNYQMQVLWRYTWCAPWQVLFINYLFSNGFTPAECLLIVAMKTPWEPVNTTPYHVIGRECLVSPDLVLPLLESLGEVAPNSYTINSKFIHEKDNDWINGLDREQRPKAIEGMRLRNFEEKGVLTYDTFLEDLGNLSNIRHWIARFN